jgi:hypothetical protein
VILAREPPAAPTRAVAVPAGLTVEPAAGVDGLFGDAGAIGRDEIDPLATVLGGCHEEPLAAALVFDVDAATRLSATDVMLTPLLPLERQ